MAVTLAKTSDSYTPSRVQTVTLPREVALGASLVGAIVTYNAQQYRVHSVEGRDWFAFDDNGQTKIDTSMTHAFWIKNPEATIIPMGRKIGDGFSFQVPANALTRGVCLAK